MTEMNASTFRTWKKLAANSERAKAQPFSAHLSLGLELRYNFHVDVGGPKESRAFS